MKIYKYMKNEFILKEEFDELIKKIREKYMAGCKICRECKNYKLNCSDCPMLKFVIEMNNIIEREMKK